MIGLGDLILLDCREQLPDTVGLRAIESRVEEAIGERMGLSGFKSPKKLLFLGLLNPGVGSG